MLRFSKMHGLGNDFVVVDGRTVPFALDESAIRAMADRHTGVGFDQLLSVEPARDPSCAFYYGIWNTDGSQARQCGNGVRCVAAWLHRAGALGVNEPVRLESPSGPVAVRLLSAHEVTVDMGEPVFEPARIPFQADAEAERYLLDVNGELLEIGAVSMGNPHAVVQVPVASSRGITRHAPAITAHPRFPQGANAGFAEVLGSDHVRLLVHERGVGWTQACGTGACAAMAVLHRRGAVDDRVRVDLPGGSLHIDWRGAGHTLWMSGPAAFAFEGEWFGMA